MSAIHTPEVPDPEEKARMILEDVKRAFGTQTEGALFRALAAYPKLLEELWSKLGPIINEPIFERNADRLRWSAITLSQEIDARLIANELVEQMNVPTLEQAQRIVTVYHYLNPKLLLLAIPVAQTLKPKPLSRRSLSFAAHSLKERKPDILATQIELSEEDQLSEDLKPMVSEIRSILKSGKLPDEYNALALLPSILKTSFTNMKATLGSAKFKSNLENLKEQAQGLVVMNSYDKLGITPSSLLVLGMTDEDIATLAQSVGSMVSSFAGQMMINAAILRAIDIAIPLAKEREQAKLPEAPSAPIEPPTEEWVAEAFQAEAKEASEEDEI